MDERVQKIVKILYHAEGRTGMNDLAGQADLSEKTIRRLLEDNEEELQHNGAVILYSRLKGFTLEVLDAGAFGKILNSGESIHQENRMRVLYIIKRLIDCNDWITIDALADELYVSRQTLDRLMPYVKAGCAEYHLTIVSKPKYGIAINGSEKNKRIAYVNMRLDEGITRDAALVEQVQNIIESVIHQYDLSISDENLYNLSQHCIIAIRRIKGGNAISEAPVLEEGYADVMEAAEQITRRFEEAFDLQMPADETTYVAMHLAGKQMLNDANAISSDVFSLEDEILQTLKKEKGFDFTADDELKTALLLHLQPLLTRMKYGIPQRNPMRNEIKREMNEGYEAAMTAANVIQNRYGQWIGDDELAYLALHFAVAHEKQKDMKPVQKKIAVVCATGRGTARLIEYRLNAKLHIPEESILMTSAASLGFLDFSDISCILTTIPLPAKYPVPVVMIDLSLSDGSAARVQSVISKSLEEKAAELIDERLIMDNVSAKNRDEVLHLLCERVKETTGNDLEEMVLKRESLSSTEVGSFLALPHPYQYEGERIILAFLRLKKPVLWKFSEVKLVLLAAYPSGNDELQQYVNERITAFASDPSAISGLSEYADRQKVIQVLLQGGNV